MVPVRSLGWNDPARAIGILIEPGIGGRWLEVWDEATKEGYELGRVLVWEPGERLVLTYRNVHLPPGDTEIEVRFESLGAATRVTLEHRGVQELSEAQRANAWVNFMAWFREYRRAGRVASPHCLSGRAAIITACATRSTSFCVR